MQERELLRVIKNKRGVGEGISWFGATIVIFFIVVVALIVYKISDQKMISSTDGDIAYSSWKNLENLRDTEGFLINDLNNAKVGEAKYYLLGENYADVKTVFEKYGETNSVKNLKISMNARGGKVFSLCTTSSSGNLIIEPSRHSGIDGFFTYATIYSPSEKDEGFVPVLVSGVKCDEK
jgi:hypothetical protein